ncbi:MAG: DinB family protein [Longimicrobiales bacterium]|nr:DinB family protein [Longimicrobiales bacterium]
MSDATSADSRALIEMALGDLEREMNATERVLKRVPEDELDWRPHERSWTLGELAAHVANLLSWAKRAIEDDEYDMAAPGSVGGKRPESTDEILDTFYGLKADVVKALGDTDDATMSEPWTLRQGDRELFTLPKAAVLRTWSLSHMIHHRGQLTVYLRLLDVAVPPTYGPTADEKLGLD